MRLLGIFGRKERVLKTWKSGNDTISIVENDEERILKFNNVVYSKLKKDSFYTGAYWDYFLPLVSIFDSPDIFMIGLGGGTIIYQIEKLFHVNSLNVAEINEKMIEAAKFFIGQDVSKYAVKKDGLEAIRDSRARYDLIILDAYKGDSIPEPFLDENFAKEAEKALKTDGILAINYALTFKGILYMERYLSKLRKFFKVYTLNDQLISGNTIIICSKKMNRDEILLNIRRRFKTTEDSMALFKAYYMLS
ncbi:fused MFS/spermidine synthase [Candidatus Parvarchaeota archaeon]|nr:fused MFS/spermidine synthase [Candidatus Parvarchaeota archaeon]